MSKYVDPSSQTSSGPGGRRRLHQTSQPQLTFGASQAPARKKGLTLKNLRWSGVNPKAATYVYMEEYTSLVLDNVVASTLALYCVGCHATVKHSTFENADTANDDEKMAEGWGYLAKVNGVADSADNSWPVASKLEVTNSTFIRQYMSMGYAGAVISTATDILNDDPPMVWASCVHPGGESLQ